MKAFDYSLKKSILFICAFFFFELNGICQDYNPVSDTERRPNLFIGRGLGINEYGLGLNIENFVTESLSLTGFAGIGGWGAKFGGSLNIYPSTYKNGEISLGYSYASGWKNFEAELSTRPYGEIQSLSLELNHVRTINIIYSYNLDFGRGKIVLSAGYAICLTVDPYIVKNPAVLDKFSTTFMNVIQPGGLILGYKIMIGPL